MRVLLVCDSSLEKNSIEQLLIDQGHTVIANIRSSDNITVIAEASRPGAVIVYAKRHERNLFNQLDKLNELHPCPVIVFVEKSSGHFARDAVKAGISAYIVDGFSPERLKTIVDIAVARFEETKELKDELSRTKEALSDRKLIDKAKGILIAQKGLTEDEAYQALRKMAMNQNLKMVQMAKNVITVSDMLTK